jgi:hypothetical protein
MNLDTSLDDIMKANKPKNTAKPKPKQQNAPVKGRGGGGGRGAGAARGRGGRGGRQPQQQQQQQRQPQQQQQAGPLRRGRQQTRQQPYQMVNKQIGGGMSASAKISISNLVCTSFLFHSHAFIREILAFQPTNISSTFTCLLNPYVQ